MMLEFRELQPRAAVHGWILYDSHDSGLNMHYIDLYRRACEKYRLSAALGLCGTGRHRKQPGPCDARGVVFDTSGSGHRKQLQAEKLAAGEAPDFVINRTRDYRIAQLFEKMGIPVFNASAVARLGNDKLQAYRYMQEKQIPVMPFVCGTQHAPPWYPAVIKSCSGHGGTQVYLVTDSREWEAWNREHAKDRDAYLMQKAASRAGRDVRVYIVGNQITAAVLRSSDTDFRSNYCLGGKVSLYELDSGERELVLRAAQGLDIGMAGMDFIFHNGELVFNEIEDTAGARALYHLTDYDIVDDYVRHIRRELESRGLFTKPDAYGTIKP